VLAYKCDMSTLKQNSSPISIFSLVAEIILEMIKPHNDIVIKSYRKSSKKAPPPKAEELMVPTWEVAEWVTFKIPEHKAGTNE